MSKRLGNQTQYTVSLELRTRSKRTRELPHLLREVLEVLAGALLPTGARIKFTIPHIKAPFTPQTMALMYLVFTVEDRAWRSVLTYIARGLAGAPVLAYGGGPHYVASPTFSYILGFLVATLAVRKLVEPSYLRKFFTVTVLVHTTVYTLGILWLSTWTTLVERQHLIETLYTTTVISTLPFIPWDFAKAVIATLSAHTTKQVKKLMRVQHLCTSG